MRALHLISLILFLLCLVAGVGSTCVVALDATLGLPFEFPHPRRYVGMGGGLTIVGIYLALINRMMSQ